MKKDYTFNRLTEFSFRRFRRLFLTATLLHLIFATILICLLPELLRTFMNLKISLQVVIILMESIIVAGLGVILLSLFSSKNDFLLKMSTFLFSRKNQKEVFDPIIKDWQQELDFERMFNKNIWKIRWINVRYTYAFLLAMWMKSPIGDLIEFIRKFAK